MPVATERAFPDLAARIKARQPNGRCLQIMHHRWEDLLFLHWRCPVARIQATLPAGLTVDTFEGEAYLGITPFFMLNVRPIGLPVLPWFSFFQELNVRTYVFDHTGTPGVWFYSLDCNRALATWGARTLMGLPYFVADMTGKRDTSIDYSSRRRGSSEDARYRYRFDGTARAADPASLEFFLLERYYLFACRGHGTTLVRGQVSHAPYLYRDVQLEEFSTIPAQLDGFDELTSAPDHVCGVDGFDVSVFAPETV